MDYHLEVIKVVPSPRPTIITMEIPDEDVRLAFSTRGKLLRERMMLALLEALVYDVGDLETLSA